MDRNRHRGILIIMLSMLVIGHTAALAQYDMNFNMAVKQGSNYTRADLDGTTVYFSSFGFYDLQTSDVTSETNWGTMAFSIAASGSIDAAGSSYSSDSGLDAFSETGSFDVDGNGIVDLDIGLSPQTDPGKGYLSANKEYMVIRHATTWTTPPEEIMLKAGFGMKLGGTFVPTDFNGTFYLQDMEIYAMGSSDRDACVIRGTVEINVPNFTVDFTSTCSDGSTESDSDSGTIAMNADGSFILTPSDGTNSIPGQLSVDKNIFVMSFGRDHPRAGTHNGMAIGIRASGNSYTNADLNGDYQFSEVHIDDIEAAVDDDRDGTVSWGTITFDGDGGFTFVVAGMDPDASTSTGSGEGTYTVSSNGELQLNVTGVDDEQGSVIFLGHLSSDGEVLVMTRAEGSSGTTPTPTSNPDDPGGGGGGGGCFIQSLW